MASFKPLVALAILAVVVASSASAKDPLRDELWAAVRKPGAPKYLEALVALIRQSQQSRNHRASACLLANVRRFGPTCTLRSAKARAWRRASARVMIELLHEATNLYDARLLTRCKLSSRTSYHPTWGFRERFRKILNRGPIVGGPRFRGVALFQKQIAPKPKFDQPRTE